MAKYDVGILGAGRMGAAFVRHFAAQGHEVAVWNRSVDKAAALASSKVTALLTVDELLKDSDLVINVISGYENLEKILRDWESPSPINLLNLATGAPGEVPGVLSLLAEGSRYLDGANLNFPQYIGTESGFIALAGSAQLWAEHQKLISSLCGEVVYLAEDVSLTNVLDTGYVGLFEIPTMVAFLESADYLAQTGISDDVIQKLIEVQSRDMGATLRQVFAERDNPDSSDSASIDTYQLAVQTYLETVNKAGHFPKQLQEVQVTLDDAVANGLGDSSIAALTDLADAAPVK